MPTQLKLFSTSGSDNLPKLEREVNAWLTSKGDSIQPVNSQTAACSFGNAGKESQAVVIALWYLDPPVREHH